MATYFERDFKRKDGTTYKRWCGEEKINGKTRTVYGKKEKECREKLKKLLAEELVHGYVLDSKSISLAEWTYKHLFTNAINQIAKTTFSVYVDIYNNHIKDSYLGTIKLKDLRPMHFQEFFNGKLDNSKAFNNKIKFVINGALKSAKANQLIHTNPLDEFKMPNSTKETKKVTTFTPAEQKLYLATLEAKTIDKLLLCSIYTGLRMGELIALEWSNYDGTSIQVVNSTKYTKIYNLDGTYNASNLTKAPKTTTSIRTVPLPKIIITMLDSMKKEEGYVFPSTVGTQLNICNIRRRHNQLCELANVPQIGLHSLRHAYATRLLELDENPRVIQELLGHKDIKTTLNIYSHVLEAKKQVAVSKLELL